MDGSPVKSAQIGREELMRPASSCFPMGKQQDDGVLVVQDDTEEGAVHAHLAVVVDEASLRIVFIKRLAISTSVRNDSARFKGCGQTVF
jgi:hypothetical protein